MLSDFLAIFGEYGSDLREGHVKFDQIRKCLNDERCGLYLLAAVDADAPGGKDGTLTVHAARGAITRENMDFINSSLSRLAPRLDVRICCHTPEELHSQDSLERFARLFKHEKIISDPTGSFARVSKLIQLAKQIRTEFGQAIGRILWQAEERKLFVLLSAGCTVHSQKETPLDRQIRSLVDEKTDSDLHNAIDSVQVCSETPAGKCTPVDIRSCRSQVVHSTPAIRRGFGRLLARLSKIAVIIGLGSVSTAHAGTPDIDKIDQSNMSGITALVGLTTLGENSFGLRNRYQAMGGLRLYFGDAGALVVSTLSGRPAGGDLAVQGEREMDTPAENGVAGERKPASDKPVRVAYAA